DPACSDKVEIIRLTTESQSARIRNLKKIKPLKKKGLAPRARFGRATLRLTALRLTQSKVAGAERNRGESASSEQMELTQVLGVQVTQRARLAWGRAWRLGVRGARRRTGPRRSRSPAQCKRRPDPMA